MGIEKIVEHIEWPNKVHGCIYEIYDSGRGYYIYQLKYTWRKEEKNRI